MIHVTIPQVSYTWNEQVAIFHTLPRGCLPHFLKMSLWANPPPPQELTSNTPSLSHLTKQIPAVNDKLVFQLPLSLRKQCPSALQGTFDFQKLALAFYGTSQGDISREGLMRLIACCSFVTKSREGENKGDVCSSRNEVTVSLCSGCHGNSTTVRNAVETSLRMGAAQSMKWGRAHGALQQLFGC